MLYYYFGTLMCYTIVVRYGGEADRNGGSIVVRNGCSEWCYTIVLRCYMIVVRNGGLIVVVRIGVIRLWFGLVVRWFGLVV